MFPVLIQSLVLASGGILSFGSITIVILLLLSEQGWRNGIGYVLGYVGAYTVIGVSAVVLNYSYTATETPAEEPSLVGSIVLIILGLLLLWVSWRNWRKPPSIEKQPPRLFTLLDKITPAKAFVIGAVVTVVNFKNLAIFMSSISVLLVSDLVLPSKLLIVLLDVLVFCLAVIVPVGIYFAFPETAGVRLNWIKQTLDTYSRPVGIWMPLIFGCIFLILGAKDLF